VTRSGISVPKLLWSIVSAEATSSQPTMLAIGIELAAAAFAHSCSCSHSLHPGSRAFNHR
jgi:hypothetical protein